MTECLQEEFKRSGNSGAFPKRKKNLTKEEKIKAKKIAVFAFVFVLFSLKVDAGLRKADIAVPSFFEWIPNLR
jgi:hypothetical protein